MIRSRKRYKIFDTIVGFESDDPWVIDSLAYIYSFCETDEDPELTARFFKQGNEYRLTIPEVEDACFPTLWRLLLHFKHSLTLYFWRGARPLVFHGGGVAKEGKGIVLIGGDCAGKTFQTLALVERGFSYLGDEYVPLDIEELTIGFYPAGLAIRRMIPNMLGIQDMVRKDLYEMWRDEIKPLVPPPIKGKPVTSARPKLFLFLEPDFKNLPKASPLPFKKALDLAFQGCHGYGPHPEPEKERRALKSVVRDAASYTLRVGPKDETMDLVEKLYQES